jgi:hypothetical protein
MRKVIFKELKKFKYVYLHPHGLGDLIISMPYINWIMFKNPNFVLCVKDNIYNSGFFNNFTFKSRVFPGCPSIWNKTQTFKTFKRINKLCEELIEENTRAFYIAFNKNENRRLQVCKGLSKKLNQEIPFRENMHGEVYLSDREINWVYETIRKDICFFHTYSATPLKSVVPPRLKKYVNLGNCFIYCPSQTNNINLHFAAQMISKKNVVIDSVYMHSAGALNKDIDVLFVSVNVKKFFNTLVPTNIKIHKIIYGDLVDVITSFMYYNVLLYCQRIFSKGSKFYSGDCAF